MWLASWHSCFWFVCPIHRCCAYSYTNLHFHPELAFHGFSDACRISTELRALYHMLFTWLCPISSATRTNADIWKIFHATRFVLGLYKLCFPPAKASRYFVAARMSHHDVHYCSRYKAFKNEKWKHFIRLTVLSLLYLEKLATLGCVYTAISTQTEVWYVGFAKGARWCHGIFTCGAFCRFIEHIQFIRNKALAQSFRPRNNAWRRTNLHNGVPYSTSLQSL